MSSFGKCGLNWENAQRRAEDLADRLQRRMEQLAQEKSITATAPVVRGGLVVIPQGLLDKTLDAAGTIPAGFAKNAASRREIEIKAMDAVMDAERALGNEPTVPVTLHHVERNSGLSDSLHFRIDDRPVHSSGVCH